MEFGKGYWMTLVGIGTTLMVLGLSVDYFLIDPRRHAEDLRPPKVGGGGTSTLEQFYLELLGPAPRHPLEAEDWAYGLGGRWGGDYYALQFLLREGYPRLVRGETERRELEYRRVLVSWVNAHKTVPWPAWLYDKEKVANIWRLSLMQEELSREAVVGVTRQHVTEQVVVQEWSPGWWLGMPRDKQKIVVYNDPVLSQYRSSNNSRYRFARERLVFLAKAFSLTAEEWRLVGLADYEVRALEDDLKK